MEKLKPLDEICKQDSRQAAFKLFNHETREIRDRGLKDFYTDIESIKLHSDVPEHIRSHFTTALNLLVYSWFHYPFNVTAEFFAYITVEYALKARCGIDYLSGGDGKNIPPFKKLLEKAVREKWITDEGFSHLHIYNAAPPDTYDEFVENFESKQVKNFCEILVRSIPWFRNNYAHGSYFLHPNGRSTVAICAELINQLFSEETSSESPSNE